MKGYAWKVISAGLIALPALAGCSPENKALFPSTTTVLTAEPPFQINMSLDFAGKEVPQASNEVQQTIELYTNTKLQITYNQASDYNNKLPAMIATGQLPMVIAGDPRQSYILSAIEKGDFWNLTDYIDDYRNLSTLNPLIYDNVKVDKKLYGLPRTRPISRNTVFYRKDWLEALGLKPPATIDDFYQMLKAFTEDDPDRNGKSDTYGVSYMMTAGQFIPDFGVAFGSPNNWKLEDGTFTRMEETPEYMDGLNFAKKLYDENLMNHDFASVERAKFEGDFEDGKAGAIANTTNTTLAYQSRVQSHSPMSLMDMTGPLAGPDGLRVAADRGSNGMIMFPKSSVKTEDDLRKLLTFFDKLADNEMADLLEWGIPGKHYELKDGKPQRTNQDQYENQVAFPYKWVMRVVPTDDLKTPGDIDPITKRQLEVEDMNGTYAIPDPTITLFSKTWTEKGNELLQILNEAKVKYVMGKIDEAGFKSAIEIAKKHGLDQAASEYAEAFANLQNKDNE